MEYKDFEKIKGVKQFKIGPHKALMRTLEDFFGATVRLVFNPLDVFKIRYSLDITLEPKRSVYKPEGVQGTVLLLAYVERNDTLYYLGIQINSPLVEFMNSAVLHLTSTNIGRMLTEASENSFKSCLALFNESLAKEIIVGSIGRGYYDLSKVKYLVDMFMGLRSTTFEGKYFSTGLILTKSLYAYRKAEKYAKDGKMIRLNNGNLDVDITDRQNTRFWYLVDGFHTFYLTDLKKTINSVFHYNGADYDYVSEMLLNKTLQGADALFRVSNGRELSIIDSDGMEFLHQEKAWKYRDYDALKTCVIGKIPYVKSYYDTLMRYVLDCSKNDSSSIIWQPRDINAIDSIILESSKNQFTKTALDFNDPKMKPIVRRLLSSDGATVIDANGKIRYFGCIADISKAKAKGIKGTGETAASLLAQNGMAIKISQDGPIKIFMEGLDGYISF